MPASDWPEVPSTLPDGRAFVDWNDRTAYRQTLVVAQRHPQADDANPGTEERPLRTVSAAAQRTQPGDQVLVRAGIYRETVAPTRGGTGPDGMIWFRAAPGEEVILSGAEPWTGPFETVESWNGRPVESWSDRPEQDRPTLWTGVPSAARTGAYNAFALPLFSAQSWFPFFRRPPAEYRRILMPRGEIFHGEQSLRPVTGPFPRLDEAGSFAVLGAGERIIFRLAKDAQPKDSRLEISVREFVFRPAKPGLGYIRLSGFIVERAANGTPWPQRGAISTHSGHHWIIEDNWIRDISAVGIDIGQGGTFDWSGPGNPAEVGGHIVRRNRLERIGVTGICGTGGITNVLIEQNHLEAIGIRGVEHGAESAAIKLHRSKDTLIRRNVILGLRHASGVWLDFLCGNSRVSQNVIHDVETILAGIYIEANRETVMADGNVVSNLRDDPTNVPPKDDLAGGIGISVDISDRAVVAHNLIAPGPQGAWAVAVHHAQKLRPIEGGVIAVRDNAVLHNIMLSTGSRRMLLHRPELTRVEGNAHGGSDAPTGFEVLEVGRTASYRFSDWQQLGFDRQGAVLDLRLTIDPSARVLRISTDRPTADFNRAPHLPGYAGVGPFSPATGTALAPGATVTLPFPAPRRGPLAPPQP